MTLQDLQLDNQLYRVSQTVTVDTTNSDLAVASVSTNPLSAVVQSTETPSSSIVSGELIGNIFVSNGFLRSKNFVTGVSGWTINADGSAEFDSGYFRGDITGATGTFSGTVSVGSLNIPDSTTASSMHVDTNGNAWWGTNVATGYATAPAKILATGAATFTSATITGALTTSAGSVINGTYIDSLNVNKLIAGTITSKAITLAVSAGTGDVYIAAGKTDFTNTDAGFILGIDDSDSDLAKFYLGNSTSYLNWTGSQLVATGVSLIDAPITNLMTIGESLTVTTPIPVYISTVATVGSVYQCDDTNAAKLAYTGMLLETATATEIKRIQFSGIVSGFANLSVGSTYYLKKGADAHIDSTQQQVAENGSFVWGNDGAGGDDSKLAQTFTTDSVFNILTSVKFKIGKNGTPSDAVQCKLYASDKTTLLATATNTVSGGDIASGGTVCEFTFTPIALSNSTTYFIEVSRTGSQSADDYTLKVKTSSAYSGGTAWRYDGSWTEINANEDTYFIVYLKENYASGDIAITPGVNSVKVGRAVSATQLLIYQLAI